jgi:hypothetical protein
MRNLTALLGTVAILALIAGCAPTTTTWVKSGAGMKQASKDLEACAGAAGMAFDAKGLKGKPVAYSSQRTYDAGLGAPFEKCMKGKGYRK